MAIEVTDDVKFEDVSVKLSGTDGNAFAVIGRCNAHIKKVHGEEAAQRWRDKATTAGSYDELIGFCMSSLDVS